MGSFKCLEVRTNFTASCLLHEDAKLADKSIYRSDYSSASSLSVLWLSLSVSVCLSVSACLSCLLLLVYLCLSVHLRLSVYLCSNLSITRAREGDEPLARLF